MLSVWRCGDGLFADARVFRAITDGKRSVISSSRSLVIASCLVGVLF